MRQRLTIDVNFRTEADIRQTLKQLERRFMAELDARDVPDTDDNRFYFIYNCVIPPQNEVDWFSAENKAEALSFFKEVSEGGEYSKIMTTLHGEPIATYDPDTDEMREISSKVILDEEPFHNESDGDYFIYNCFEDPAMGHFATASRDEAIKRFRDMSREATCSKLMIDIEGIPVAVYDADDEKVRVI